MCNVVLIVAYPFYSGIELKHREGKVVNKNVLENYREVKKIILLH